MIIGLIMMLQKKFEYPVEDGNIDFIYKIHKYIRGGLPDYHGANTLGGFNYEVDPEHSKWINVNGFAQDVSGISCLQPMNKDEVMAICSHEHGHFTFAGGHLTYGKNVYGLGAELFYSPYEMIASNYMYPRIANFGETNYLGDFSSRNNQSGEIIKIPISDNECFLLSNRRKVSDYDRLMLGDTAIINPNNNWDYGKGLYIYHVFDSIQVPMGPYSTPQDMECADGLFQWDTNGRAAVDLNCWTGQPDWYVYKKSHVIYSNDPSGLTSQSLIGDGLSLWYFTGYNYLNYPLGLPKMHDYGKNSHNNCLFGTDRIFTNDKELYSKFDRDGDRYDAWNVGYNEIFSPFSSPSTCDKSNAYTGIFIYYNSLNINTNEAAIDIYKSTDETSLNNILELTPPSRPMGLTVDTCFAGGVDEYAIKLEWNHNKEPDMLRISDEDVKKRYNVFRSVSVNENSIPPDTFFYPENKYVLIKTVDIDTSITPFFLDTINNIKSICVYLPDVSCPPICYNKVNIRYRVQAVDIYDDVSRLSDFVQTPGFRVDSTGGTPEDNGIGEMPRGGKFLHSDIPKEYDLAQNYPNPFNPVTKINYAIPKSGFVTLKIYDITGREIKTLVNELKQPGYYTIDFNGSELSSGVYFCRIVSGSFVSVKRMILIK